MSSDGQSGSSVEQADRLKAYVEHGNEDVPGWLDNLAIRSLLCINEVQLQHGVRGAMCEIGVHRGRLLILLHLLSRSGEKTVGFDLFEGRGELDRSYGAFDYKLLQRSLDKHGCDSERISLVPVNSLQLSSASVLRHAGTSVRMFSVDGGHDAHIARNDLRLAADVLSPGGVVVLDDFFNEQWCGVVEGTVRFMLEAPHLLIPFLIAGNKFLFTSDETWARRYKEMIDRALSPLGFGKKQSKFFSHEVLVFWRAPISGKARLVTFVLGHERVQWLRSTRMWSKMRVLRG